MRKAILASVILSAMFSVAQAADVKLSGDFGYRYDDLEVGTADSQRDRLRVNLKATADVNADTKVVVGLRTGSVKSSWNDMDGNSLKNVAVNLAYVEYAAAPFAKVTPYAVALSWVLASSLVSCSTKSFTGTPATSFLSDAPRIS